MQQPSESPELLRSAKDMGQKITIHHGSKQNCTKTCSWDNPCSHDGNEKHVPKKPGVDHPIGSVDDLGTYEVAHGNFIHKNSQVAILNTELANDSLYTRSLPQNGICPSESSQAMISLNKFDMRSTIFASFLTSHHAIHH